VRRAFRRLWVLQSYEQRAHAKGEGWLNALFRVADHHAVLRGTVCCGKGCFKHGTRQLAASDVDRRHDSVDVRPDSLALTAHSLPAAAAAPPRPPHAR
jgi:hypothetical protein